MILIKAVRPRPIMSFVQTKSHGHHFITAVVEDWPKKKTRQCIMITITGMESYMYIALVQTNLSMCLFSRKTGIKLMPSIMRSPGGSRLAKFNTVVNISIRETDC